MLYIRNASVRAKVVRKTSTRVSMKEQKQEKKKKTQRCNEQKEKAVRNVDPLPPEVVSRVSKAARKEAKRKRARQRRTKEVTSEIKTKIIVVVPCVLLPRLLLYLRKSRLPLAPKLLHCHRQLVSSAVV